MGARAAGTRRGEGPAAVRWSGVGEWARRRREETAQQASERADRVAGRVARAKVSGGRRSSV